MLLRINQNETWHVWFRLRQRLDVRFYSRPCHAMDHLGSGRKSGSVLIAVSCLYSYMTVTVEEGDVAQGM